MPSPYLEDKDNYKPKEKGNYNPPRRAPFPTASEMKKITEQNTVDLVAIALEKMKPQLESASKKGLSSAYLGYTITEEVTKHLESLGYRVKVNSGYDPRDQESYGSTTISW